MAEPQAKRAKTGDAAAADGGQQLLPGYVALNPNKELPTLCIDGLVLKQSLSIIQYLDETRPDRPLLPSEAGQRARARQLAELISGIQTVQNLRVLKKIMAGSEGDERTKRKIDWGKHWITLGFEALERELQASSGKYCVGDEVTIADLALVPQVYNARRFQVDMELFPKVAEIEARLNELDEFKASHPSQQPDAVV